MSILNFFKPKKIIPAENSELADVIGRSALTEANERVDKIIGSPSNTQNSPKTPRSAKRGNYLTFSPKDRADIGKYCAQNGPAATVRKFSGAFPNLAESTVRGMKRKYDEHLNSKKRKLNFEGDVDEIHSKKRGRPLLVGTELDSKVQKYINVLRDNGAVINTQIVIAAAKGIIIGTDKTLLVENGGSIEITKNWAKSLLHRMNFVKRRGSTACKSDKVENFDELKKEYLERIEKTVVDFDIPSNLVINWDHAGLNVVPVSNWTMAVEGSKRVEISGLGDKRQITGVFAGSLSGEFLPPQIIYGGKTDKCHPIYKFPSDWDITHSENHWANTDTQMEYVKNIILPYIRKIKRSAKLNKDQKALCIFDVFRAQMGDDFLAFLDEINIKVVFVPPCCTDRLQPLDVSVQKAVKNKMRNSFEQWYSNEIVKQLDGKEIVDSENEPIVPVDLSLTRLKPLSAKWLVQMFQHIKNNPDIVRSGFRETGISGALDDYLEDELPLSKMSRDK